MRILLVESAELLIPKVDETDQKRRTREATFVNAINSAEILGLDIETGFVGAAPLDKKGDIDYKQLTPLTGEIKSIQICLPGLKVSGKTPVVQLLGEECRTGPILAALLKHVQDSSKLTAIHNALYESHWFLSKFGVLIQNPFCTLVGHQMETAGLAYKLEAKYGKGVNSLKTVTERKLGVVISKELQLSDWGQEITREQSLYACLDAYLTYKLYLKFKYLLESPVGHPEWIAGKAEMGSIPVFAMLNYSGMPANIEKLKELCDSYGQAVDRRYKELIKEVDSYLLGKDELRDKLIPKSMSKKKRLEWEFNIGSSQQMRLLLNSMLADMGREPITSTDASHLEELDLPFTRLLSEYRSLKKMREYMEVFISNYNYTTGSVFCNYSVLAYKAASGRSSASDGSLQIVGNTSPVLARDGLGGPKTGFGIPRIEGDNDEEHFLLKCDLPGSHSQLAGFFAQDPIVQHCLIHNEKIHYHTLARMLQLMGVVTNFQEVKDWFAKPNHGGIEFRLPNSTILTPADIKSYYTGAKNIFYGFLNFAGAITTSKTFLKKGMHVSVEDCRLFLQACKETYTGIYSFQRCIAKYAERNIVLYWDEPELDRHFLSFSHLYGAVKTEHGPTVIGRVVKIQMPDGRVLYFPAVGRDRDGNKVGAVDEDEAVDTLDEVTWNCKPSNIVASHWLSPEATIMKTIARRIQDELSKHPEWQASIRAFAHDEVTIWVLKRYLPDVAQLYMDICTDVFRIFVPFFVAEAPTVMENWEKVFEST
jgi:hypothetical protein